MAAAEFIEERRERDTLVLAVRGRWLVAEGAALQARLAKLRVKQVTFDLDGIDAIDTTGAWLLLQLKEDYAAKGAKVAIENIHDEYDPLFRQLEKQPIKSLPPKPVQPRFILLLNYLGSRTVTLLRGARGLVGFLGLVTVNVLEIFRHRSKIRIVPLVVQMAWITRFDSGTWPPASCCATSAIRSSSPAARAAPLPPRSAPWW